MNHGLAGNRGEAAMPGEAGWGRCSSPPEGAGAMPALGTAAGRTVRANFRGGIRKTPCGQALHAFTSTGSGVRRVGATQPVSCLLRPAGREARGAGKNSTAVLPGAPAPRARDFLRRAVPPWLAVDAAPQPHAGRLLVPVPSCEARCQGIASPSVPSKSKSWW